MLKNHFEESNFTKILTDFTREICGKREVIIKKEYVCPLPSESPAPILHPKSHSVPERFGSFGGQYAPEALIDCLDEIEGAFSQLKNDGDFWNEFRAEYEYIGRPSTLHVAHRLSEACGGAKIWLKREDLNHTGSHKINNAMGQILMAKRLGKTRIIAETGAGQHGKNLTFNETRCRHSNRLREIRNGMYYLHGCRRRTPSSFECFPH